MSVVAETTTQAISAPAISRMIGKTWVRKQSVNRSKIVRGWADFSEGYVVEQHHAKVVIVSYDHSSSMRYNQEMYIANRDSALLTIAELLTSKGYDVVASTNGKSLVVRKVAN
jgi:hypothetical protein